jgi:hypothetical protein
VRFCRPIDHESPGSSAIDTPKVLSLAFTKGSTTQTLFENERHPKPYEPPSAVRTDDAGRREEAGR